MVGEPFNIGLSSANLTKKQLAFFDENGYVVVNKFFTQKAINEMVRVVKPGGYVEPHSDSLTTNPSYAINISLNNPNECNHCRSWVCRFGHRGLPCRGRKFRLLCRFRSSQD